MSSMGVFPTNAPSTQTCAGEGVERNNNLLASFPAPCSRALRLTTSGGGPVRITRCVEALGADGLLGAGTITDFSAAVVEAETDAAPAYSAAAWPLATPQQTTTTAETTAMRRRAVCTKFLFIGSDGLTLSSLLGKITEQEWCQTLYLGYDP